MMYRPDYPSRLAIAQRQLYDTAVSAVAFAPNSPTAAARRLRPNGARKIIHFVSICLALGTLWLSACKENDKIGGDADQKAVKALYVGKLVAALGGEKVVRDFNSLSYTSTGKAYEFQEAPEPQGNFVADFTYQLAATKDLENYKIDWSITTTYAYESALKFTETVAGTKAGAEGITGFFSANFGGFGVKGDEMFSTKLAARRKAMLMASPLALARFVLVNQKDGPVQIGREVVIPINFNTSALGYGDNTPDIEVVVDAQSGLPLRAQALENDPSLGDVRYEVLFADWRKVGEVPYPYRVTHRLNGNTIREEQLKDIVLNPALAPSLFTVANPYPYDAAEARAGYVSSQMHFRTQMQTFPLDFTPQLVEAKTPLWAPSELLSFDSKVLRIAGELQTHYTYAFDLGDSLLVYDTPVNNRRSAAVLKKIREVFGAKPISHVVISHNHFDHVGGFRGALAEGGKLVVGASYAPTMQRMLQNPHTVLPNPLANPTAVKVLGVRDQLVIGRGDERVELYVVDSDHTLREEFLVLYKPKTKLVLYNDLYNPGFYPYVYNRTTPFNRRRLQRLAAQLVNAIDARRLGAVPTISIATHGIVSDNQVSNLRALASERP